MDAEPLSTRPLRANPISPTAPAQATGTTQDSPQDRRVTKVKDPTKVTAGRKGAAARKAKQETLLGQLRKAKDGLRPADEVSQEETSPEHHVVKTADPTSEFVDVCSSRRNGCFSSFCCSRHTAWCIKTKLLPAPWVVATAPSRQSRGKQQYYTNDVTHSIYAVTACERTMSTPSTDGKQFANLAYTSAVVSGLCNGIRRTWQENHERCYTKIRLCTVLCWYGHSGCWPGYGH